MQQNTDKKMLNSKMVQCYVLNLQKKLYKIPSLSQVDKGIWLWKLREENWYFKKEL
jgi:hypothetical protein